MIADQGIHIAGGGISKLLFDPFAWKYLQPAQGHLPIRPSRHDIGPIPQHDVQVIGKDGVRKDIDPEDGGQLFDSLSDPFFSVGKILPRNGIDPAEVRSTDAPLHNVQDGNLEWQKNLGP